MILTEAFEILRRKYGSHSAAARALSFNISHYRNLRNGRVRVPTRTADLILFRAREASLSAEAARLG